MDFKEFPKMPRLSREIIVTEKIDGTNAQVAVAELDGYSSPGAVWEGDGLAIYAGSRTRWITPEADNFGFAAWVRDNAEELATLGPGNHFGEWWGRGIQRGYGLIGAVPQKRGHRWNSEATLAIAPPGCRYFQGEGGEYEIAIPPEPKLPMACTFIAAAVFREILEAGLVKPYIFAMADGRHDVCHTFFGYELVPAPEWSYEYKVAQEMGLENPMVDDGEDHYFCRRAAQVGYESLIDVTVELRHWEGQVCHDYSFKKYLAENAANLKVEEQAEAA